MNDTDRLKFALAKISEHEATISALEAENKRLCERSNGRLEKMEEHADTIALLRSGEEMVHVATIGSAFLLLYSRINWSEGLKVGDKLYALRRAEQGKEGDR